MRKYLLTIAGLVLLCLLAAWGTASGSPDTITVDSTTDVLDAAVGCALVGIGDLPGPDKETSLREAICAANDNAGSDIIEFNIPVTDTGYEVSGITGTWTISLTSSLPTLTDDGTIISGTTQAANQGNLNLYGPEIEISGASIGSGSCLRIESAGNVVHGLVINRCPLHGVTIHTSATTNTVSGNYIGTDASGSTDLGNGSTGVLIVDGAQGNVVGGDTPEERNVISGNDPIGVYIYGSDTMSNTVSGNYIGTDATGTQDLGNAGIGVAIFMGPQNNSVGGDTEGERNIISGNDGSGVSIGAAGTTNNTISGNFIGTDASGSSDLGNSSYGVQISSGAQNNTIGPDNLIAHNGSGGIRVRDPGTTGNTITRNSIHSNSLLGIDLYDGGNDDIPAPTSSAANACFVMGRAGAGDTVEVFTGLDEEGKTFVTTTSADGSGIWTALGPLTLDTCVTATATDASGNTSRFSFPVAAGACYPGFLPLGVKNY